MKKNQLNLDILNRSLSKKSKIILPEKNDVRVKSAIKILLEYGFEVIDIDSLNYRRNFYKESIISKKFTANWTEEMLDDFLVNPINFSFVALLNGDVDCAVAGANASTADVIRSAIRIVGLKSKTNLLSSSFFMTSHDNVQYTFSDCAVVPEPKAEQLCSIAYEAVQSHELLSNEKAKVAFLSFSTKGSATHYKVKKMQDSYQLFKKKYPDIVCDGELQFDAAINPMIANKKNPDNTLGGRANVFIFPDLDSGNIAYKITQHLAGYKAWGPLLQGLNKSIHDLSRGCNVEDVVSVSMIAALQAK